MERSVTDVPLDALVISNGAITKCIDNTYPTPGNSVNPNANDVLPGLSEIIRM